MDERLSGRLDEMSCGLSYEGWQDLTTFIFAQIATERGLQFR